MFPVHKLERERPIVMSADAFELRDWLGYMQQDMTGAVQRFSRKWIQRRGKTRWTYLVEKEMGVVGYISEMDDELPRKLLA